MGGARVSEFRVQDWSTKHNGGRPDRPALALSRVSVLTGSFSAMSSLVRRSKYGRSKAWRSDTLR
eukprot:scaffold26199_cov39-Isochrysis_galbana.AAC.1